MRGLPRALRSAPAPDGTALRLTITGDAGGEWVALRDEARQAARIDGDPVLAERVFETVSILA